MNFQKSKELYERGSKTLVGAVNSPVRAFKSVGGNPLFIQSGKGSKIKDTDGNTYLDLVGSYGPMILGHAHPKVLEAVNKALTNSFSFGASTEAEILLAEEVVDTFSEMEMVRFVNSGTEAVLSAIRLARAVTGKNKIIKFSGCYHGHSDALLVAAGSGLATLSMPGSAGVPKEAVANTLIANFNDIESVKAHFETDGDNIAAVFIEPVAGNMGVVLPNNNFLNELRKITKENNALLVFDEVMTGYRKTYGGAQKHFDIKPDITCLGKVIGGGFPVGAYGASKSIMENVAPLGNMYQAGTLSGNPIAMAAGLATLTELKSQNPYERFENIANQMKSVLVDEAGKKGISIKVNQFGSMINPFFTSDEITDFASAQKCDTALFSKFFWNLIQNGIYIPPSQFEAWFLPSSLTDDEVNELLVGLSKAIKEL
jgi:glutamate-1-semialdehyde 2,1-aminomutase